jgi:signal transduction histidine kinase
MPGFGLTIMKERIENLGGCFEIAASDGKGCSLSFHFPFVCENMAVNGSGKV